MMMKNLILSEIYNAITEYPNILTPPFIEELLKTVLPIAESDATDKAVKAAINQVYQNFPEVAEQIANLTRKNRGFGNAEPEVIPGYETLTNNYPDIKKLEANFKKRIQAPSIPPAPDAKN